MIPKVFVMKFRNDESLKYYLYRNQNLMRVKDMNHEVKNFLGITFYMCYCNVYNRSPSWNVRNLEWSRELLLWESTLFMKYRVVQTTYIVKTKIKFRHRLKNYESKHRMFRLTGKSLKSLRLLHTPYKIP